ncbi:hypothetical protein ACFRQM_49495 [Streptomyces sp. NPDC056831]|uniref:hypothetical protein n=1 Tax=Streptomyces sp. NPDC056831 TaxID=3345954 RepID=UPI00369954DF
MGGAGERAAAAADAVRQALPCGDCGQEPSAGLCEACGYRRRTEALTVEAALVAATWAAALDDAADVAAVTADVRASLEADIERARRELLAGHSNGAASVSADHEATAVGGNVDLRADHGSVASWRVGDVTLGNPTQPGPHQG